MENYENPTSTSLHPVTMEPLPAEKPIPCRHCARSYKAVNVRDLHEKVHLNPFICNFCDQKFPLKSHLRNHLGIHSRMIDPWQKVKKNTHTIQFKDDTARFQCEYCEKEFYSKPGYTAHLKQKHFDEVEQNTDEFEPDKIFVKEEPVLYEEEYIEEFLEENQGSAFDEFVCKCGRKFKDFIDLVRHESDKHTEDFERMVQGLKDLLMYVIKRMDDKKPKTVFKSNESKNLLCDVKKEEKVEIEPSIHEDSIYDDYHSSSSKSSEIKKSKKKIKKKSQIKEEPSPNSKSTNKQDKFLCQYCDKQLAHRKSLEYHVAKKHQNVPIFRCKLCNRYFTEEAEYQLHEKSHEDDPELICSTCGFQCKGQTVLRRHIFHKHKSTEVEPRFYCQTCNKGFYYKCKLEEHAVIHKPPTERTAIFSCNICNAAFNRKSTYNRHIITHDESSKIYTCTFCSKTFRRKQHLTNHLSIHTGARPREEICADCGAIYSERRGLNNHMERVHGRPLEGYRKQIKITIESN
uniref:CSON011838 protein n=1 Tax=Culicoides sonorensis TaxID=179676 RepID=A0A336KMT3_CULSO